MRHNSVKVYKKIQSKLIKNKVRVNSLKVLGLPDKRFCSRKSIEKSKPVYPKVIKKSKAY
jgi:hypothetical protein